MPDLDEKVYALDTRVSHVETSVATTALQQTHHAERMNQMDKRILDHMEQEEVDRKIMEEKLDGLLRYKWILFGMMVAMWLTSGENHILQLLKVVG